MLQELDLFGEPGPNSLDLDLGASPLDPWHQEALLSLTPVLGHIGDEPTAAVVGLVPWQGHVGHHQVSLGTKVISLVI